MNNKVVIVSGATGQDGSYLCDYHLANGDQVIGLKRRSSTENEWRLKKAKKYQNFKIEECDITDAHSVAGIVSEYHPDIFYNLCAQSNVATSFKSPHETFQTNTIGVLNCLEAVKNISPSTRFIQAGTSEQFGSNYDMVDGEKVQHENTKFMARSPYAVSKCAAYDLCRIYRDGYNLFIGVAISFNHGSPRRGCDFVEMKIAKWLKEHRNVIISNDIEFSTTQFHTNNKTYNKLRLGNLDAFRDFTDARDIVQGLVKIAEYDEPEVFVLCSGRTIQIRELVGKMFNLVGVKDWEEFVYIDPEFYRPAEVDYLRGSNSKARKLLGWTPKITFDKMVWDIVNEC